MSCCSSAPRVDADAVADLVEVEVGGAERVVHAVRQAPPPAGSAAPRAGRRRRVRAGRWRRRAPRRRRPAGGRAPGPRPGGGRPASRRRWPTTGRRSRACRRRGARRGRGRCGGGRCRRRAAARARATASRGRRRSTPRRRARRVGSIERAALGPDDDEGVALAGAAGGHEARHAHAGPLGEQRHEPLVLDELDAGEARRALAAAVPRQAPQRRQQLGVPRVAAVDLDVERAVGVVTGEADDTRVVPRRRRRGRRRRRRARAGPARCASSSGARRASRRRGARRPPPGGRP